MSRPFTLLATLLFLAPQATVSAEDNLQQRFLHFSNGELVRLPEVDASNDWIIRGQYDSCSNCDDGSCSSCADSCCDAGLPSACDCNSNGWLVDTEILYFQYLKADGVRTGTDSGSEDIDGDYEISPRITLGYETCSGMGLRTRWWMYDHEIGRNSSDVFAVDTYTVDLELFESFNINDCWALEASGGLRYNNFDEVVNDGGINRRASFSGVGAIVGGELSRKISCGRLFSRIRLAMLADDKSILNTDSNDDPPRLGSTQGMVEVALGHEHRRTLSNGSQLVIRGFAEWQNWYNYSESLFESNNGDENNSGPSDIGFFGFGASMGFIF